MELEALAPGRIDLGLGRALGADALTGRALGSAIVGRVPAVLRPALGLAAGRLRRRAVPRAPHPFAERQGEPGGPSHPDLFLLCSSVDSAPVRRHGGRRHGVRRVHRPRRRRAGGGRLPRGVPALGLSRPTRSPASPPSRSPPTPPRRPTASPPWRPRPPHRPGEPPESRAASSAASAATAPTVRALPGREGRATPAPTSSSS